MNGTSLLDIESLTFDKENPRLPTTVRGDDCEILEYLATKTGIERLLLSIGENGFFPGEAIIVIEQEESDKYIVIEGNRRLAALKLLQNPSLVNRVSIRTAVEEAEHRPSKVPAYIANSRDDTLQYLGFRHVSGVQRWDPLAKARYLKTLFDRCHGEPEQRYSSVAREIGSKANAVRRHLDALATYDIIERRGFYDIEELEEETFQFGTFYTAVGNTDIANFIGTKRDGVSNHPIVNPCEINENHLEELVTLMFEQDDQGSTKLGESRNISKLGEVLDNLNSLKALREGQSLDAAYRLTPYGRDEFMRRMNQANQELRQANANLYDVEPGDEGAKKVVGEALKIIQHASKWLGEVTYD